MPILILLIVAILPAALLWWYIWKKDPQKEPTPLLIKAGLYGAGICLPVALFEFGVQSILFGGVKTPSFGKTLRHEDEQRHSVTIAHTLSAPVLP